MNRKILNLNANPDRVKLAIGFTGLTGTFDNFILQPEMAPVVIGAYENFAQGAKDEEALTEKFVTRLKSAQPSWAVEVAGPLIAKVTYPDGKTHPVNLQNLSRQVRSTPEEAEAHINTFVKAVSSIPETLADDSMQMLLPVIMNAAAASAGELIHSLNDELDVHYVQDFENTMRFIPEDALANIGMSKKELRQSAINNLGLRFPQVDFREGEEGVRQVMIDPNYDASLVLLPDLWDKSKHPFITGEFIIAVPARDQLYCCDSKNAKAVKTLRDLAKWRHRDSVYPISDKLFIMNRGELRLFHQR